MLCILGGRRPLKVCGLVLFGNKNSSLIGLQAVYLELLNKIGLSKDLGYNTYCIVYILTCSVSS